MLEKLEALVKDLQKLQDTYDSTFNELMKGRVADPESIVTEPITTNVTIALQSIYVARVAMSGAIRDYKIAQETKDEN